MSHLHVWISILLLSTLCLIPVHSTPEGGQSMNIAITSPITSLGIGRTLTVHAVVTNKQGKPVADAELHPYANGLRWGAHEVTNTEGKARFMIPFPDPGPVELKVVWAGQNLSSKEQWIWNKPPEERQTLYFQKVFEIDQKVTQATLWVAVDDHAKVFLNGHEVANKAGWTDNKAVEIDLSLIKSKGNVLSVEGTNGGGPAGLLLALILKTDQGEHQISSDATWQVFKQAPEGWPLAAFSQGGPVEVLGGADTGGSMPSPWPGLVIRKLRTTGTPMPADSIVSNTLNITVEKRELQIPPKDPNHLIGMQYETWFTPLNICWQTGQAIPLMGLYQSYNRSVERQHILWMIESGIDFLLADWSNHIWFSKRWEDRAPSSNEIIETTTLLLEVLDEMRKEGYEVPKLSLLIGISHVRPEGPDAVRGMLAWIHDHYIANERFKGLWQELHGKPLICALDLGASYLKEKIPLDDRFTLRFMGAQQDSNHLNEMGLWSWMDCTTPQVTYMDGKPEAVTVNVGHFGPRGWKYPPAKGQRGGATLVETFPVALDARPLVLQFHQFNEFAGQPEGQGHGPNHDYYYDSYSSELNDDIEPTSLSAPAYRGTGGWGFLQLNLVRALVDLYRLTTPETTAIAISTPLRMQAVEGDTLTLEWSTVGVEPKGYSFALDGKEVMAKEIKDRSATLSLGDLAEGVHQLRLTAKGTKSYYPLVYGREVERLREPVEAYTEMDFVKRER